MLVVVTAFGEIQAQQKLKFTSINVAGLLTGSSEPALQLQTINGVRYKDFTAAIGIGMDNYYFKSIPVFVHFSRQFTIKNFTPFVYSDIGVNLPEDKDNDQKDHWRSSKYDAGLYFDLGVGYTFPVYKKMSVIFSLGYSQKHLNEERSSGYFIGFPNAIYRELPSEYYSYAFRRISLKAGLSF